MLSFKIGNRLLVFLLLFFSIPMVSQAQVTAKKLLPRNINISYLNQLAPSVSGDGNHLVFLSDQVSSKRLNMMYSRRTGPQTWSDPEVIKEIDNSFEINHLRGYSISFDGKIVFFTTLKSGGIGGYDVWMIQRQGNGWSQPQNPGKPLNTSGHEADASLSADGKTIYFTRCEKVNMNSTENCTIYYATKKNSFLWNEPIALPANINTGNAVSPRILSDNETLYFSADKAGGQGGYDLYMSRKDGEGWTGPVALDFINSEVDDRYVGLTAKGDILFYSMKYKDKDKLVMAMIPEEYQPLKIYQINGKVTTENDQPLEAIVQVYDVDSKKLATAVRAAQNSGAFYLLLKGGAKYDLSINPSKSDYLFHSEMIDLSELESSNFERKTVSLKKIQSGLVFTASNIAFQPNSAELQESSLAEIRRLSLLLRNNPGVNMEIGAHLGEYLSDSIPSSPELTEVKIDTVLNPAYEYFKADSLMAANKLKELRAKLPLSANVSNMLVDSVGVDTEVNLVAEQIAKLEFFMQQMPVEEPFNITKTYHNDRTEKEAEAVYQALLDIGVPEDRISFKGYGISAPIADAATENASEVNRRVEVSLE